jgi:lipopolysaccharide/colanic/teichoic acid biosynthesis glycosyltransferase
MLQAPTRNKATFINQSSLVRRNPARLQQASKALLDYMFVAPTIILLLPLFLIIAILIKLESPGPVFHRRRVIGVRGQFFEAFNFRTTYVDGDARLTRNRADWVAILNGRQLDGDPRVTGVGRLLRRYGLDDLPRLFNIMNRQMSLVGPQLLNHDDVSRMGMRWVEAITTVKPGLTGVWQIRARRQSVAERARLELDYINNWSVLKDLQILFGTLLVVREGQFL